MTIEDLKELAKSEAEELRKVEELDCSVADKLVVFDDDE